MNTQTKVTKRTRTDAASIIIRFMGHAHFDLVRVPGGYTAVSKTRSRHAMLLDDASDEPITTRAAYAE